MSPEERDAWGKASRAASGVPDKVEDPAVLARLVTLAFAGTDHNNDGGPGMSARRRFRIRSSTSDRQVAKQAGRSDGPS
jgi:hypothetical protein